MQSVTVGFLKILRLRRAVENLDLADLTRSISGPVRCGSPVGCSIRLKKRNLNQRGEETSWQNKAKKQKAARGTFQTCSWLLFAILEKIFSIKFSDDEMNHESKQK